MIIKVLVPLATLFTTSFIAAHEEIELPEEHQTLALLIQEAGEEEVAKEHIEITLAQEVSSDIAVATEEACTLAECEEEEQVCACCETEEVAYTANETSTEPSEETSESVIPCFVVCETLCEIPVNEQNEEETFVAIVLEEVFVPLASEEVAQEEQEALAESFYEVVNLRDIDEENLLNLLLGYMPTVALEVSKEEGLPVQILLSGDCFELVGFPTDSFRIQLRKNMYISVPKEGELLLSTNLVNWAAPSEFFTGDVGCEYTSEGTLVLSARVDQAE